MFTLKFYMRQNSEGLHYSAISCPHYEVYHRENGSAAVITYPTMYTLNGLDDPSKCGVEWQLSEKDGDYNTCYIENGTGKTIEVVKILKPKNTKLSPAEQILKDRVPESKRSTKVNFRVTKMKEGKPQTRVYIDHKMKESIKRISTEFMLKEIERRETSLNAGGIREDNVNNCDVTKVYTEHMDKKVDMISVNDSESMLSKIESQDEYFKSDEGTFYGVISAGDGTFSGSLSKIESQDEYFKSDEEGDLDKPMTKKERLNY